MAYQQLVVVSLSRGGEWGSPFVIAPTERSAIYPQPPNFMGNTIIAVVERVIVFQSTTNAFLVAVAESRQITERGCWFPPAPETAPFGGYYLRIYSVNKPQIQTTAFSVYKE